MRIIVDETERSQVERKWHSRAWLHVWPIALAHREVHSKVRIESRELVHAGEFLVTSRACTNIESNATLMARGGALDVTPSLLALDDARPTGTWASLAVTHASLLLGRSVRRSDGHMPVSFNELLQKADARAFALRSASLITGRSLRNTPKRHCIALSLIATDSEMPCRPSFPKMNT